MYYELDVSAVAVGAISIGQHEWDASSDVQHIQSHFLPLESICPGWRIYYGEPRHSHSSGRKNMLLGAELTKQLL